MQGVQCDTCRTFALPEAAGGWLLLTEIRPAAASPLAAMMGGGGGPELTGTFCCVLCLLRYAYVRQAAEGQPAGTEPAPRQPGAEGWLG